MKFINILFILILLYLLIKIICSSYEYFTIDFSDKMNIKPPIFDVDTGVVMSSPEINNPISWSGQDAYKGSYEQNYFLDDGGQGELGLNFNLCSKTCCMPQYPLPFDIKDDGILTDKEVYVGSNYTCRTPWQSTGCVCMKKEQRENLENRGGNAY